jgi:hypothetical protein
MSKDMSMTMSLSFARPITLAIRNAAPVPIIPKSHKLQKSVSVHSVSCSMQDGDPDFRISIGAETDEALSKGLEKLVFEMTIDSGTT